MGLDIQSQFTTAFLGGSFFNEEVAYHVHGGATKTITALVTRHGAGNKRNVRQQATRPYKYTIRIAKNDTDGVAQPQLGQDTITLHMPESSETTVMTVQDSLTNSYFCWHLGLTP